jgi:molybdenum cofactor cytidylyltransferase
VKFNSAPNKTAGVLLAAGGSKRLGHPKQLIQFRGQTLIHHMISVIKSGGIVNLFVVAGAFRNEVIAAVKDLKVHWIINTEWERGLSTSIQAAIKHIQYDYDAAIFFVVDQPFLEPGLVMQVLAAVETEVYAKIIATRVESQQTHPVAYRKSVYKNLLALKGDSGGRDFLRGQAVHWIDWPNKILLQDVDTQNDFQSLNLHQETGNPAD